MLATREHSFIDLMWPVAVLLATIVMLSSCEETCYDGEQNQNETEVDCGGDCVPCDTSGGTCYDGIQNQGETGVDCGGPCNACVSDTSVYDPNYICEGSGGSDYFPLSLNSYWIYDLGGNSWFMYRITESIAYNSEDYWKVQRQSNSGTTYFFLREDGGQIYRLWDDGSGNPDGTEEVYIPSNPATGQQWTTPTTDSVVIDDDAYTLNSSNGCQYDNVLVITAWSSGSGSTDYFKQGVGLVQQNSNAILDSLVIF